MQRLTSFCCRSRICRDSVVRCPCILLLDTSGSMQELIPITQLNAGLVAFEDEMSADALAEKRVEVALVTFGPVQVQADFQTADQSHLPTLVTGDTPMGAAIEQAFSMLEQRKTLQDEWALKRSPLDFSHNRWRTNRCLGYCGGQNSCW